MDAEHSSSISLRDLDARAGEGLPVSVQPLRRLGARLASAQVIPLHKQDSALQEEAQIAATIAQGICDGDGSAETRLVERYSNGLRYLLLRRTRDDERAQDLLQDTLYIAITKLREIELDEPARLAGYLRGIAIRVALNDGRRRQREPYPMAVEAVAQVPGREPRQFDDVARDQSRAAVHKLLKSMPVKRDRELLRRFYVEDQDKDEICKALDLNSLHFNRVLYRAKNRFRKLLEESSRVDDLAAGQDDQL
jgi:RNA polymerase sigma-70 factor (ECF subfamily)